MVPVNDNHGNVVSLDDYREPVDTRATEFFNALADEFLGEDVIWASVVLVTKSKDNEFIVKERLFVPYGQP
jgi:hypothetical protein